MQDTYSKRWLPRNRRGASLTELIVACGLLVASLSIFGSTAALGFATQRLELQRSIAADELANQLEQLIVKASDEVIFAVEQLEPSPLAKSHLSELQLSGELLADAYGKRVVLRLSYAPRREQPLVAVGWLPTDGRAAADASREGDR